MTRRPMRVRDLIASLLDVPMDAPVYITDDRGRPAEGWVTGAAVTERDHTMGGNPDETVVLTVRWKPRG
jgi:hypothetical protein